MDPVLPLSPNGDTTAQASPAVAMMRAAAEAKKRALDQQGLANQYKASEEARMQTQGNLANARESRIATQDQNAADTQTMANDLSQWSQNPSQPQYRASWDQTPDEVKTHVATAYPGVSAQAPHIWNNAVTQNTGVVTGQPVAPLSPALKISAANHGIQVDPHDTADDITAKINQKQQSEMSGENSGLSGEDALGGMNPDEANMVRQIANYDLPTTALSRLPPAQKLRILGRVSQYDPTFSATEYPARQMLKTSVKAGPISENIKSANTAVAHLNTLLQSANQLNNGNFPLLNKAGNFMASQAGSSAPSNFDTARNAVVAELSKVFKGAGAVPVSEINHWRDVMNSSQSPEQIKGGVKMALDLMGGRFGAIQDQYERGMGRPKDFSILTPKSRAILRTNGFDPDEIEGGTTAQDVPQSLPPAANSATPPARASLQPVRPGSGIAGGPQPFTPPPIVADQRTPIQQVQSAQAPSIPTAAVQHLQQHPELAPYFEQKYGQGSSAQYLTPPTR